MKVDMNKKYRTVNGYPVRFLCVDRKSSDGYHIIGLVDDQEFNQEIIVAWTHDGKTVYTPYNLVEMNTWDELKRGDACLVRDNLDFVWITRVFYGISVVNRPLVYNSNDIFSWNYCIPFDENLVGKK